MTPSKQADGEIQMTKEQYDSQKLSQVDKSLNLNTYQFSINQNERKVNSQFIEVIGKEDSVVQAIKRKRQMLGSILESRIKALPFIRNIVRSTEHAKILTKPKIEKFQMTLSDKTSYEYLMNPRSDDVRIQNFLALEKQYADIHFSAGGRKAMTMSQAWFKEYSQFYDNYPFFCDRNSYSISSFPIFQLEKRPFHNTDSLLDFKNVKPEVVLDQELIMEYLMGFKDDFSYFVCRFLKNNLIQSSMLDFVTISDNEQFVAVGLQFEDKHLTLVKNMENNTFLNFYLNQPIEVITFHSENGKDYSIIFKETGSNEVRQVAISTDEFAPPRPLPSLIQSITKFMRDNQANLTINDYQAIIKKTACLLSFEIAPIKTQFLNFGRHKFLKSHSESENEFRLFYLHNSGIKDLGVRWSDISRGHRYSGN